MGRDYIATYSGITLFGVTVDFGTYKPNSRINSIYAPTRITSDTDPTSEAIHLALLASALNGDIYAREFFRSSNTDEKLTIKQYAIVTLFEKILLYAEFGARYPGYGGFLPYFDIYNKARMMPNKETTLYFYTHSNFCWAMIAVVQVINVIHYLRLYVLIQKNTAVCRHCKKISAGTTVFGNKQLFLKQNNVQNF